MAVRELTAEIQTVEQKTRIESQAQFQSDLKAGGCVSYTILETYARFDLRHKTKQHSV